MEYSIKDLETFTGIKAHTIRIWEKRYKILVPERTETNIRHYSEKELKYLMNIAFLNKNGFKISKLATIEDDKISELVTNQLDESGPSEKQIEILSQQLIELDAERFEESIDQYIQQFGLQETVINIITPFMQKIGWLWRSGAITPVHEHFASNIIRKKILQAIDSETVELIGESQRYTLFLPENEQHELGILFAYYLLFKRGQQVLYLGQNMPVHDMINGNSTLKTDAFVTAFTTPLPYEKLLARTIEMGELFAPRPLFIKTHLFQGHKPRLPKNVKIIQSWIDLVK